MHDEADVTSFHWLKTRRSGQDVFVSVHLVLNSKISLLKEISNRVDESSEFVNFLIEESLVENFFSDVLNENLIDKWKEKFDTAKEVLKTKGKEVLSAAQEKMNIWKLFLRSSPSITTSNTSIN